MEWILSHCFCFVSILILIQSVDVHRGNQGGECGQTHLTSTSGHIQSPNFPLPYGANTFCEYHISVGPDPNRTVILEFTTVSTEECTSKLYDDYCDWVKVFDGNTTRDKLVGRFSGNQKPFVAKTGPNALVQFKSNDKREGTGFSMQYRTGVRNQCEEFHVLTYGYGMIESPNYPKPYPSHCNLTWILSCPDGGFINLLFHRHDFETEEYYDYFELTTEVKYENGLIEKTRLTRTNVYSGRQQPLAVDSMYGNGGTIVIRFISDGQNEAKGFKLFCSISRDKEEKYKFIDHYLNPSEHTESGKIEVNMVNLLILTSTEKYQMTGTATRSQWTMIWAISLIVGHIRLQTDQVHM